MKFKAVIFDLDGTLLDTLGDLADSMNSALLRLGFSGHSFEAYKMFVGAGMENLVRRALPADHREQPMVLRGLSAMMEEYGRRCLDKTLPYAGIPELLDALTTRRMTMVILSNKPDDFTRLLIRKLLPRWRFDRVVGARPSVPKKPNPTVAIEIAQGLGIQSETFLFLGDTGIDMETAIAAGMFPVGVSWGFRPAAELQTSGAKIILDNPLDLLTFLDQSLKSETMDELSCSTHQKEKKNGLPPSGNRDF